MRRLALTGLLFLLLGSGAWAAQSAAMVTDVYGDVRMAPSGTKDFRPVRLFDAITAGTTLRLEDDSAGVHLAFREAGRVVGARGKSTLVVSQTDVKATSGTPVLTASAPGIVRRVPDGQNLESLGGVSRRDHLNSVNLIHVERVLFRQSPSAFRWS